MVVFGSEVFGVLCGARAVEVLFCLRGGCLSVRELCRCAGGSCSTVLRRVGELESIGLVRVVCSRVFPFEKRVCLTGKGRRVLRKIVLLLCDLGFP
ncbi:MAG: hypothetical protein DRO23_11505 [Thermoprotei archaeon]|nr:MAG: hypothetical protein DRO23_11505 [Thermoprotei archaeon]